MIAAGSGILPLPLYPSAKRPVSGSITRIPSCFNCCKFLWNARLLHIWLFIAGITYLGAAVAKNVVLAASSAIPLAIFAIKLAVAGTTTAISVQSANSICWILSALFSFQRSVNTGCFVKAAKVCVPIK